MSSDIPTLGWISPRTHDGSPVMCTREHNRAGTLTSVRARAMTSSESSNGAPSNRFFVTSVLAWLYRPCTGPVRAQIVQPSGEFQRRIGQRLGALRGERRLVGLGLVPPAARVSHHHLE